MFFQFWIVLYNLANSIIAQFYLQESVLVLFEHCALMECATQLSKDKAQLAKRYQTVHGNEL